MDGLARYRDRYALVTGASRGIGAAVARRLASEGIRTILTARSGDALEEVRASLPDSDHHVTIVADLANDDDLAALISTVSATVGSDGLALLVLNAGTASQSPVSETTTELWDRTFRLNARAPFILTRDLMPLLNGDTDSGRAAGRIVFIGSVVSTRGYENQGAYTASKHALHGFAKVTAREVADAGIVVHSVLPGGVDTDLVREMRPDIDGSDLIAPNEVAAAIINLISMDGNAIIDEIHLRRRTKQPY